MKERDGERGTEACADIAELLPFHLNGSLDEVGARRVEAHLASCAACRRDERDTRTAFALHAGHLPVELLLDYALEKDSMSSRAVAVVESHLPGCARCAGELAAIREDDRSAEPVPFRPRVRSRPRRGRPWALALAAGLATVVASSGWLWTWLELVGEREAGRSARANLPVVELLPAVQPVLQRGGAVTDPSQAANRIEVPEGTTEVVLVLLAGGRSCEPGCDLEIHAPGEAKPSRRVEGLVASADGHVTLSLPRSWLGDRSVLALRRSAGEPVEYLIEVTTSPPSPFK